MTAAGFMAAAVLAVTGCDAGQAARSAADCVSRVRLDGRAYSGYGYTDHAATELAKADVAECHDLGEEPEGSVFTDDPRQVPVWSIRGYPPEQVVGVRRDENSYEVFVAESVPRADVDRIVEELSSPGH